MPSLRVASFHVRATTAQSARWKQAADSEGQPVSAWLAGAADAYLKVRARAGSRSPSRGAGAGSGCAWKVERSRR